MRKYSFMKKIILYAFNKIDKIIISDKLFLKIKYRLRINERLNLSDPDTFNEKLQWLKLYDRNPKYSELVDKYTVKKYIENKLGEEYIIKNLGIWDNVDSIKFEELPEKFVLKTTHDSGGVIICKNKSELDIKNAKKRLKKSLKRKYYPIHREWSYKNIIPRIIAEEYMVDESGKELKDYKIFCFNGKPKIIQVDFGRFTEHKRNIYDLEWNLLDVEIEYPSDKKVKIAKPKNLDKMLEIASVLSKDIPHIRVDLYSIKERIYFGELTFYHGAGYEEITPNSFDKQMGDWIELPVTRKVKNEK